LCISLLTVPPMIGHSFPTLNHKTSSMPGISGIHLLVTWIAIFIPILTISTKKRLTYAPKSLELINLPS